jgi:hypothetical protein
MIIVAKLCKFNGKNIFLFISNSPLKANPGVLLISKLLALVSQSKYYILFGNSMLWMPTSIKGNPLTFTKFENKDGLITVLNAKFFIRIYYYYLLCGYQSNDVCYGI